jgi:hypothetical protein
MPTIWREGPYRVFFYSNEGTEPAHVHVYGNGNVAKFWLANVSVAANNGFAAHELKELITLVRAHRDDWLRAWDGYFGPASR